MNNQLVTALVTTYNLERFVKESLWSVFNQTYEPLEIVISDDCSTDRTWEIIQHEITQYRAGGGGHTVVAHRNERNLGVMKNFEKAISMSHSEIIVECDGDDISRPNRVARIAEEFAKTPNLQCLLHDGDLINQKGKTIGKILPRWGIWGWPLGAAQAYRFSKTAKWPEITQDCYQDGVYTYRAIMSGDVITINDNLIQYRIGCGISSSRTRKKKGKSWQYVRNFILQSLDDLSFKKKELPLDFSMKIERRLQEWLTEASEQCDMFTNVNFFARYKVVRERAIKCFGTHSTLCFGLYLDLLLLGLFLLPPGRCDFLHNSVTRAVEFIRKVKGK